MTAPKSGGIKLLGNLFFPRCEALIKSEEMLGSIVAPAAASTACDVRPAGEPSPRARVNEFTSQPSSKETFVCQLQCHACTALTRAALAPRGLWEAGKASAAGDPAVCARCSVSRALQAPGSAPCWWARAAGRGGSHPLLAAAPNRGCVCLVAGCVFFFVVIFVLYTRLFKFCCAASDLTA